MIHRKIIYTSIKFEGIALNFLCLDVITKGQKSVLLNYHFSWTKCPRKLHNIYIYMYRSPKLPFFYKTCPLKLHNSLYIFICTNTFCQYINIQQTVWYPTIFLLYERTSVFYYIAYNRRIPLWCLDMIWIWTLHH